MCGIAGILHWDKAPVAPADLTAMASLLKHRGPDEQNTQTPSAGVGFAHCRLKVIDLSDAARQPMSSESGQIHLLFNGEIYNFKELRRELISSGSKFRSQSDTEVILRAYERWGKQTVRRLDGMFALAIWDGASRKLLLARDRMGKKPLFYWTGHQCIAFGSEIKALLAHAHVPCEVAEELFPYLLTFGAAPADRTFYRQIRQLPPASLLEIDGTQESPQPESYWELPRPERQPPKSPEEAEQELRELLTAAVRKRLVSDVPLGAFLSGGIDSSIVVGLISRLWKEGQVKTFSIGFEGDDRFNETEFARTAAERFKTSHIPFTVGPQPFSLIEKLVWHHDQPFADSSALPTYLLSQLTRSHVTVALSGDGGDELFAGYDRFQAALAAEWLPGWVWKGASGLLGPIVKRPGLHVRSLPYRIGRFLDSADQPLMKRYLSWRAVLSQPEEVLVAAPASAPSAPQNGTGTPLFKLLRFNFTEYLPCDLLVKSDRCSMAHGLEVRSPFLDTALVEWAFRLPDSLKIRGGKGKWILRRAFRELLPESIQTRSKMGFGVPLGVWFRNQWSAPLKDLLLSPETRVRRYINAQWTERIIESHLGGRQDAGHALWLMLTFELWLRQQRKPSS